MLFASDVVSLTNRLITTEQADFSLAGRIWIDSALCVWQNILICNQPYDYLVLLLHAIKE